MSCPSPRPLLPVLAGLVFFALNLARLTNGHPEEDAYILFRYVAQFVAGHGIVFFDGGPPTEGSTDFLWFLLIAGLHGLGIDIAIAAACWNAAGAALATWLLLRVARAGGAPRWLDPALAAYCLLFSGALAGYGGFASMLFSALVVLGMHLHRGGDARAAAAMPLFALMLGMFRPEGSVAGAALVLLCLPTVHRRRVWRAWALATLAATALGVAYAAWKLSYFGSLLPTAALVKSHSAADPDVLAMVPAWLAWSVAPMRGLGDNLRWFVKDTGALPFVVVLLAAWWIGRRPAPGALREPMLRPLLLGYVPCLALLAVLTFTEQTQNVFARFQAPATLGLLHVTLALVLRVRASLPRSRAGAVLLGLLVLSLVPAITRGVRVVARTLCSQQALYTQDFAQALGGLLKADQRFVLTEAGILAYYSHAQLLDAVGLNTVEFARRPIRADDLRAFAPDVVMCHHSFVFDRASFGEMTVPCVRAITPAQLAASVLPEYRWIFDGGLRSYAEHPFRAVPLAAVVIASYLSSSGDFDLFLAGDTQENLHLWGIRRTVPEAAAIEAALEAAVLHGRHPSYFAMQSGGRR
ncbi:MAG TPA: hypothetical protein VFZ65_11975 [Planctomycetota bacterium]|nr:hypothetical protein [Planctomycetota bacterium]